MHSYLAAIKIAINQITLCDRKGDSILPEDHGPCMLQESGSVK